MQVLFAAMLIDPFHAAFEDRKEPFCGIGVSIAARPFVFGMIKGLMLGRAREFENRRGPR